MNAPAPRLLSDSPWFWIYLFATAGLVGLFWMGPRYAERQSQLDRQFQGRAYAAANPSDREAAEPFSTPSDKLRVLRPLGYLLAVMLTVAWFRLGWLRYRTPPDDPAQ